MADWRHIRAHKISSERPNDWPQGVRGISQEGLSLLGINEATGQLYCPGMDFLFCLMAPRVQFSALRRSRRGWCRSVSRCVQACTQGRSSGLK
jgi:hypothetical protein